MAGFVAAKMLATLDICPVDASSSAGPGDRAGDYHATGVPFEERWKRLDECVVAMRGIWGRRPPKARSTV